MNRILLVTRPDYDKATEYLKYYASLIIDDASRSGLKLKDFQGNNANRKEVIKFIEKQDPALIFINGHGSPTELLGQDHKMLISEDQKDLALLKDRIIYARACDAGSSFGEKVVDGNKGCFIGYKTKFSFWTDNDWSATPPKDKTASLFLEPSNAVMSSLIKGDTTKVANEKSKKMMAKNMNKILKMEARGEPGAMNWLAVLWKNYEAQVLHGNPNLSS